MQSPLGHILSFLAAPGERVDERKCGDTCAAPRSQPTHTTGALNYARPDGDPHPIHITIQIPASHSPKTSCVRGQ